MGPSKAFSKISLAIGLPSHFMKYVWIFQIEIVYILKLNHLQKI